MKLLYMPLAITAAITAGNVFILQNSAILFDAKYGKSSSMLNWFSFAVNASLFLAILPAKLFKRFGAKNTLFIGGALLGGAHITAGVMLSLSSLSGTVSSFLLFLIAIVGGQGASIMFVSSIGYMAKYYSVLCTHLLNGILFMYLFFSDSFHVVLKMGPLSSFSNTGFFFLIGAFTIGVGVACAILFTKKDKSGKSVGNLAKAMVLRNILRLYTLLASIILVLAIAFMITYQFYTSFAAKVLIFLVVLNFVVPLVALTLFKSEKAQSMFPSPSDQDRFIMQKGSDVSFKKVKKSKEFVLLLLTFMIIIGVSRMVDENAQLIALSNSSSSSTNQTAFQVFRILGCLLTGIVLATFRLYLSPFALMMIYSFFFAIAQVLMFFIQYSSLALYLAVIMVGFVQGGCFVLIGIIAHEEYGIKKYIKVVGYMLSAGALGIFIFDMLIF